MKLTTIGTGTAAPSPARVQSATLLEDDAVRVLVDCGAGAVFRMAQLGIDWRTITHLALTHFHADHLGGVPELSRLIPIQTFVDHDRLRDVTVTGHLDVAVRFFDLDRFTVPRIGRTVGNGFRRIVAVRSFFVRAGDAAGY